MQLVAQEHASSLIANYAGIASLHAPSTRVDAVYASGRLVIASGHVDIAVAAGVVLYGGIKLVLCNLQATLDRAAA